MPRPKPQALAVRKAKKLRSDAPVPDLSQLVEKRIRQMPYSTTAMIDLLLKVAIPAVAFELGRRAGAQDERERLKGKPRKKRKETFPYSMKIMPFEVMTLDQLRRENSLLCKSLDRPESSAVLKKDFLSQNREMRSALASRRKGISFQKSQAALVSLHKKFRSENRK